MAQTKKKQKRAAGKAPGKHGSPAPDPAEVIRDFTETTGRVVKQAAGILEEEVAAGISAVKKLEEGFVDIGELRASEKDQVLQRFRRDAHEVVDIALDVLSTASRYVSDLSGEVASIPTRGRHGAAARQNTPTLRLSEPVSPGGKGESVITLENSSKDEDTEFTFLATDLINEAGEKIAARNITFKPATVRMGPGETADVAVSVKAPKTASSGVYSGLVQASKFEQLRAVLVAEVD